MRHETIAEPNDRAANGRAAQALERQLVPRLEDSNATSPLPRIIQLIQKRTAAAIAAGGEEKASVPPPTPRANGMLPRDAIPAKLYQRLPLQHIDRARLARS